MELLAPWPDERTPALAIVARGDQIREVAPTRFEVLSQSRPGRKYEIRIRADRWSCSCLYHRQSRRPCIHIRAVRYRIRLEESPAPSPPLLSCPHCGSVGARRFGHRYNRSGRVRRYRCANCGTRFTDRTGALRLRNDLRTVGLALDLYFRGLSFRTVADHLRQAHDLTVSAATIYAWVRRYAPPAARWLDSLGARTSEQWHVDETVVTTDGSPRWVWNVEDAGTRFWLATHVSALRRVRDARVVIRKAKAATLDRPMAVVSDGMPAYRKAVGAELSYRSGADVVNPHVRVPSIRAKRSNNLVERLHGTEKDRIKTLRGFHGRAGVRAFLDGLRVHYDLVRRHATLGSTPAVAAGLPDVGGFRWKTILERSSERCPPTTVEITLVPYRRLRRRPRTVPSCDGT